MCVEYTMMAMQGDVDPDCSISIKVIEARDLIAADAGGTSDPYVKIEFDGKVYKTGTRFKTLDPVWNEKFEYVTLGTNTQGILRFEVFDYDLVGSDDALGHCMIKVGFRVLGSRDLGFRVRGFGIWG